MDECVVRKHTRAVVQGLHYLHKKRIMHRDIKGQNVLVDNNGTAKLTDFGASEKIHTVVEYATKDGVFPLITTSWHGQLSEDCLRVHMGGMALSNDVCEACCDKSSELTLSETMTATFMRQYVLLQL